MLGVQLDLDRIERNLNLLRTDYSILKMLAAVQSDPSTPEGI